MIRLLLILCLILKLSVLCFSQINVGCTDTSYRKLYYTPNDSTTTKSQVNASDKGSFLVGSYKHLNATVSEGNIVRLDDTGRIQWTLQLKSSLSNENLLLERGKEFSDLNFVAAGVAIGNSAGSKLFLAKVNSTGVLVWQHNYEISSVYAQQDKLFVSSVNEGGDKEILIACNVASGKFGNTIAIIKLDSNGVLLWQKLLVPDINVSHLEIGGAHFASNPIVTGYFTHSGGLCLEDQRGVFAARLDNLSGNILDQKTYCFSKAPAPYPFTDGIYRFSSQLLDDGKIVLSGSLLEGTVLTNTSNRTFLTVRFSNALDILSSRIIETGFSINHGGNRIAARPNGDIMLSVLKSSAGIYFSLIDTQSIIIKQRRLPLPVYSYNASVSGNPNYSQVLNSKGASTTFANSYYSGGKSVFEFFKLSDASGNALSCSGEDTNFVNVSAFPLLNSSLTWNQIVLDFFVDNSSPITTTSLPIIAEEICKRITNCDGIKIAGSDTVCVLGQEETYIAHRNPGCLKPIKWQLDSSAFSSFVIVNDSTIRVRFRMPAPGSQKVVLTASILGCAIKTDSFDVVLHQILQIRSSGSKICPGDTVKISAGYWFKNYLWQDGTGDSVLIVNKPGKYFVRVQAHCGYTMSDTIVIGGIAPMSTYVRGDSIRCNNDTVQLKAVGGFGSYQWTPSTDIILRNDSTAAVFPISQETYKVQIDVFPGCVIVDSIRVRKITSPPLNLIADTSICENRSLVLQAASAFSRYQWSTGENTEVIIVKTARQYTVEAIYSNGCVSRDTFNLKSVYQNPTPNLKKSSILCIGQTDTLDGGNFSNYLWNNSATSKSIKVFSPGTYWVEVSDTNGCKGSDTTIITSLASPPAKFLPADTTICLTQHTAIKPLKAYQNYLWNDGSRNSSLLISREGDYILFVEDYDGCTGSDTIRITKKNCLNKIYFPNAFTPDGNGKNDLFKPTIQGQLSKYELVVFNRWGQIVFKTTVPLDGWNGNISGKMQPAGSYVWSCRYTFTGEKEQLLRGTLILIR